MTDTPVMGSITQLTTKPSFEEEHKRCINRLEYKPGVSNPNSTLRRRAHSCMLPYAAALIDTIEALCNDPSEENIQLARHISSRAKLLLDR